MSLMFNLTNKKSLVTGATGGIGGCIAKAFYSVGADVVISGSKQEKLDALARQMTDDGCQMTKTGESSVIRHPSSVIPLICDLSKLDTIDAFAK